MVRYFSAIGMSDYVDQRKLDVFVRNALQEQSNPIYRYREPGTDTVYVEVKKYMGDFAVALRGKKEEDGKVNMSVILPTVQERTYSVLLDWEIEMDDPLIAFLIGEEEGTGAQLEISLLDLVECLMEKPADAGDSLIAAFYALSTEGKILLNVERSQEDEEAYRSEEEWRRQMLKRAREGDEEALEELKADSLAMEEDILERLEEEDIYSILEGIFLPASEELLGVYTIMGTILESEKVLNPYTEEWVYRLLLNVMGLNLTLFINPKDLVGEPLQGMRFLGTGLLQGAVSWGLTQFRQKAQDMFSEDSNE